MHTCQGGPARPWPALGKKEDVATRGLAKVAGQIRRHSKSGKWPVEQPTRFELVLNLKTAKALGLTIPPSVLVRADQVIE